MNNHNQKIISIPIETKIREFDGKLWVGLNAVERGYSVVLGPSFEIRHALEIIKPDIHITKDPGDGNIEFFKQMDDAGVTVCGLDTEGAVFESMDQFAINKTELLNHIDAFYAWGEKPANAVRKHYSGTDKIHVTGNPRFDLLHPNRRFIYKERAKTLIEKYGQFILINGNFSSANPWSEKLINSSEEVYDPSSSSRISYNNRIFHLFIEVIYHLQTEFPETHIVIRPHPSEENETYEAAFRKYEHIHVEDARDVRDWIAGSSVVIHHDCTTGIESAMMGTPVVSYRPVQNEEYESRLPQIVSHEALSRRDLTEYIAAWLEADDSYKMTDEQTNELKQYFYNINGSAAELMCDVIESLDTTKQRNYDLLEPNLADSLKQRIKSSSLHNQAIAAYDGFHKVIGDESIPEHRQYRRQKFPILDRHEVIDTIEQMKPLLEIDAVSVKQVPRTNNTYYLRPE